MGVAMPRLFRLPVSSAMFYIQRYISYTYYYDYLLMISQFAFCTP